MSRHRPTSSRQGAAVVELAICIPVMALMVLGGIEVCNAIFLKQAATAASFEAVKIASATGGTEAQALTRAEEILAARSISGATISFTPADSTLWTRGSEMSVTVSVPATNLGSISLHLQGRDLEARCTMVRQ